MQFSKKRSTPYLQDDDIQILNQFSLDEHYKIVILRLEGNKQTFLLGPTQAIKLDNPKKQENEQAKLFPLKSYMDIDKK